MLRAAPASTIATYYVGASPFVLGYLYFWTDMSRNPFANQHLAEAALVTAALFLWMKFCQSLFSARIRSQIASKPMPRWSGRQCARVLFSQAIIQPSGLFIIPLALLLALPFAWVYAFYQNVTVLADPDFTGNSHLLSKARKQAVLWPGQNHTSLGIALLFGIFVFINLAVVCFSLPGLLKMLLGIETVFSRSPISMLNGTFILATLGLAYLCMDPILKIVYTLRCYYGESLQSGEDLKADLKQFAVSPTSMGHTASVLLIIFFLSWASTAMAAGPALQTPTQPAAPGTQVSPLDLDERIEEVIHQRKYTWRMPREGAPEADAEKGFLTRFLQDAGKMVGRVLRTVMRWADELFRRVFSSSPGGGSAFSWMRSSLLLYVLLAVVILGLGVFLFRIRRRNAETLPVAAEAIQGALDIRDETIGADQLPEDGWTQLARELLDRGEFRLAMRAFYLASLAHLAQRELVRIARFKSNRDYENELKRRGHSIPSLLPVFAENLWLFERIWYGMHEVNAELVQQFASNVDRIKGLA